MKWYIITNKQDTRKQLKTTYNKKSEAINDIVALLNDDRIKPKILKVAQGYYQYISIDNAIVIGIVEQEQLQKWGFKVDLSKIIL